MRLTCTEETITAGKRRYLGIRPARFALWRFSARYALWRFSANNTKQPAKKAGCFDSITLKCLSAGSKLVKKLTGGFVHVLVKSFRTEEVAKRNLLVPVILQVVVGEALE